VKRAAAVGGVLLGALAIAYAVLSSKTDEELILERMDALASAVAVDADTSTNLVLRVGALNRRFDEIFTPDVRYDIPELTSGSEGRSGLAQLAAKSGSYFETLDVSFGSTEVSVDPAGDRAKARTIAKLLGVRAGRGPERDRRRVRFEFVKGEDGWRVYALSVESGTDDDA
jgi:hypothetical protein